MKKINDFILSVTAIPILVVLLRLVIPAALLIVAVMFWYVSLPLLGIYFIAHALKK